MARVGMAALHTNSTILCSSAGSVGRISTVKPSDCARTSLAKPTSASAATISAPVMVVTLNRRERFDQPTGLWGTHRGERAGSPRSGMKQ